MLELLLGWPILLGIVVAAAIVLVYITLGGLSSAIYNEVLQFFVILAALIPLMLVGLHDVGGWSGLKESIEEAKGSGFLHAWQGTSPGDVTNPLEASWIPIVFGLGFVLSFGYWTTNFAEVQRALSAKDLNAAQRTPLIGAYPKIFIPAITIIPGMVALIVIPGLGGDDPSKEYNNAIPLLMNEYLPNGMLGLATDGPAGRVHGGGRGQRLGVQHGRHLRPVGAVRAVGRERRRTTCASAASRRSSASCIGIGTALIASGYDNIMDYIQLLFSFFNAPLFATFIVGMFWKRMTPWGGFWGLVAGTFGAAVAHFAHAWEIVDLGSAQAAAFWGAIAAFVADAFVSVAVSLFTQPKPVSELQGLVYGMANVSEEDRRPRPFWQRPGPLAIGALALTLILNIIFA